MNQAADSPRVPRIGAGRETKGVTTAVTGCVGSSFGHKLVTDVVQEGLKSVAASEFE